MSCTLRNGASRTGRRVSLLCSLAAMTILAAPAWASPDPAQLAWDKGEHHLALRNGDKEVWRLVIDPEDGKPYFHPIADLAGNAFTHLRPADHPWHRGLWLAWRSINGVNFWDQDRKTGKSQGQTTIEKWSIKPIDGFGAKADALVSYQAPGKPVAMRETYHWKISPISADGKYAIDWTTSTEALEKVSLTRSPPPKEGGQWWGGYSGLSLRRSPETKDWNHFDSEGRATLEAIHGQQARWVACHGCFPDGRAGTIVMFDHPSNARHPSAWYVTTGAQELPFLSPAFLYDAVYQMSPGQKLDLRYRIVVYPGEVTAGDIEKDFASFVGELPAKESTQKKSIP